MSAFRKMRDEANIRFVDSSISIENPVFMFKPCSIWSQITLKRNTDFHRKSKYHAKYVHGCVRVGRKCRWWQIKWEGFAK